MKTIMVLILIGLTYIKGYSCSCIKSGDLKQEIKSIDLLIQGSVEKITIVEVFDSLNFPGWYDHPHVLTKADSSAYVRRELHYTIRIERVYKGEYRQNTIVVQSGVLGWDDCKFDFEIGKSYIIFAFHPRFPQYFKSGRIKRKPKADLSKYQTNNCHSTQLFTTDFETKVLSILN